MTNKYQKRCLLVLVAMFLLVALLLVVLPSDKVAYGESATATSTSGYEITNFSANIDCSKGRLAKVTETITVYYSANTHGIYRDLTMASGEDYSNLNVEGAPFSLKKGSNYLRLVIGDKDEIVYEGTTKTYTITYNVTMPKYKESKDSLLYNVVPFGFDTVIKSFNVTLTMPTAENNGIWVVSGAVGTDTNNYANVVVDGNKLLITSNGYPLSSFNGVSVRIDFPKGTLKNVVDLDALYIFLAGALVLVVAIIMLVAWGRDDKVVEVVRFDPPHNMPPCDMGYLIDGKVENTDMTSLIFYWASLGVIEIQSSGKKVLLRKRGELPEKCKYYEHTVFNALFRGADFVNIKDLGESFANTMTKAKKNVAQEYSGMRYTRLSKIFSYVFAAISMAFVLIISTLMDVIKYKIVDFNVSVWSILIVAIVGGYYWLGYRVMNKLPKLSSSKKTLNFVGYGAVGVVVALVGMEIIKLTQYQTYIEGFAMMICPVLTCWISPYIHKRSEQYNELLGEIMGFRNFIEVAEKDKLEQLVNEDPEYFYKILPYANVLGVSDVLEDKFKGIPMSAPSWINSTGGVDLIDLYVYTRIAKAITSQVNMQIVQAAAKTASSMVGKFGGGSSGGGFRGGGGFGGGGGGSW